MRYLSICCLLLAACSSKSPSSGDCGSNADCRAGEVCTDGECVVLCTNDLACDSGEVCTDGLCLPGQRATPRITAVDGDGTLVCPDAGGTHCMAAGIIVQGENLAGASFQLTPSAGGQPEDLTLRQGTDGTAELDLPNVAPGDWVLVAANQAGTDQTDLTLLQGPPGPDLTANEMVARLNTATDLLSRSVLPVGSGITQVAAGEHGHDAGDITGVLDVARIPAHDHDYIPAESGAVDADYLGDEAVDWASLAVASGITRGAAGSYTGNGNTNGPTGTCGFQPDFVVITRDNNHRTAVAMRTEANVSGIADLHAVWSSDGTGSSWDNAIDFEATGFHLINTGMNDNAILFHWVAFQFR